MKNLIIALVLPISLTACGGGGGGGDSDAGMVVEGTLTQGNTPSHTRPDLAHSAGQTIENVEVCALGKCSTTDGNGRWGFLVEGDFPGGFVMFGITGHGIDAAAMVQIPEGAHDVTIEFVNEGNNSVRAGAVIVDGQELVGHDDHAEEHDHGADQRASGR